MGAMHPALVYCLLLEFFLVKGCQEATHLVPVIDLLDLLFHH
jgi:hypothetical protein